MTWGWVNYQEMFIWKLTNPLTWLCNVISIFLYILLSVTDNNTDARTPLSKSQNEERDRETASFEQVLDERMGDRGIIRLLVPQTLPLFLPYTHTRTQTHAHTRTHAWLTYVWKPSHVCMRGRHHVKWASVHVQHAASGKAKKERGRERGRESTEDTLLLLSGTISVFLLYTHTGQKANYSAYCLCSIARQHQTQAWSSQRPRSHQHAHTQAHHPLRTEPLQKIRQAGEKQS